MLHITNITCADLPLGDEEEALVEVSVRGHCVATQFQRGPNPRFWDSLQLVVPPVCSQLHVQVIKNTENPEPRVLGQTSVLMTHLEAGIPNRVQLTLQGTTSAITMVISPVAVGAHRSELKGKKILEFQVINGILPDARTINYVYKTLDPHPELSSKRVLHAEELAHARLERTILAGTTGSSSTVDEFGGLVFCTFSCGARRQRTRSVPISNPVWNESFESFIEDEFRECLLINMYYSTTSKSPTSDEVVEETILLGKFTLRLERFQRGRTFELRMPLYIPSRIGWVKADPEILINMNVTARNFGYRDGPQLKATLVRGKNLRDGNLSVPDGDLRPQVSMTMSNKEWRSSAGAGPDPSWDESVLFDILEDDPTSAVLRILCVHDRITLGKFLFKLDNLQRDVEQCLAVPLMVKHRTAQGVSWVPSPEGACLHIKIVASGFGDTTDSLRRETVGVLNATRAEGRAQLCADEQVEWIGLLMSDVEYLESLRRAAQEKQHDVKLDNLREEEVRQREQLLSILEIQKLQRIVKVEMETQSDYRMPPVDERIEVYVHQAHLNQTDRALELSMNGKSFVMPVRARQLSWNPPEMYSFPMTETDPVLLVKSVDVDQSHKGQPSSMASISLSSLAGLVPEEFSVDLLVFDRAKNKWVCPDSSVERVGISVRIVTSSKSSVRLQIHGLESVHTVARTLFAVACVGEATFQTRPQKVVSTKVAWNEKESFAIHEGERVEDITFRIAAGESPAVPLASVTLPLHRVRDNNPTRLLLPVSVGEGQASLDVEIETTKMWSAFYYEATTPKFTSYTPYYWFLHVQVIRAENVYHPDTPLPPQYRRAADAVLGKAFATFRFGDTPFRTLGNQSPNPYWDEGFKFPLSDEMIAHVRKEQFEALPPVTLEVGDEAVPDSDVYGRGEFNIPASILAEVKEYFANEGKARLEAVWTTSSALFSVALGNEHAASWSQREGGHTPCVFLRFRCDRHINQHLDQFFVNEVNIIAQSQVAERKALTSLWLSRIRELQQNELSEREDITRYTIESSQVKVYIQLKAESRKVINELKEVEYRDKEHTNKCRSDLMHCERMEVFPRLAMDREEKHKREMLVSVFHQVKLDIERMEAEANAMRNSEAHQILEPSPPMPAPAVAVQRTPIEMLNPNQVQVRKFTATSAVVQWVRPRVPHNVGPLEYRVLLSRDEGDHFMVHALTRDTEFKMRGLESSTRYQVSVTARPTDPDISFIPNRHCKIVHFITAPVQPPSPTSDYSVARTPRRPIAQSARLPVVSADNFASMSASVPQTSRASQGNISNNGLPGVRKFIPKKPSDASSENGAILQPPRALKGPQARAHHVPPLDNLRGSHNDSQGDAFM